MVILSWIDEPEIKPVPKPEPKKPDFEETIQINYKQSENYITRNEQIRAEKKQGFQYRELAAKYGISETRVRQICSESFRYVTQSPFYSDFEEYGNIGCKICACLMKANIDTKEKLIKLVKTGKIKKIKGIGTQCIDIILKVYEKDIYDTDRK